METKDGFEERFKKVYYEGFTDFNDIDVKYEDVKDFIRAEKKLSAEEEKQAWIRRERCSNCGEKCLDNDLSDMCIKCFEEG